MKAAIWKFRLAVTPLQVIDMPGAVSMLSLQMQNEEPTLWAIVEPTGKPMPHTILMFGTGHEMVPPVPGTNPTIDPLGTVQKDGFVWHYFELVDDGADRRGSLQ